jgi:predicted DNA-binding WGR domain protein
MDNLLTVSLEANNAGRNHHRRYEIRLGRDLFGDWTVCLLYGRVGRAGQLARHSGPDPERLRRVIHESLRRRLSAPKRIGCAYRLSGLSTADGIDVAFWLPGDTLACFREEGGGTAHRMK